MNTPTHLIITAAVRKRFPQSGMPASAVLWGSVAPDLPLFALSIGGYFYFRHYLGWSGEATFSRMFGHLYFNDWRWITLHNLLHAPLILIPLIALLWRWRKAEGTWRRWLFWFFSSCLAHFAIDLPTHADDGPLIFFPFDWKTRFNGGVSYWDPKYYGSEFFYFEAALNLLLLAYIFKDRLRRRRTPSF